MEATFGNGYNPSENFFDIVENVEYLIKETFLLLYLRLNEAVNYSNFDFITCEFRPLFSLNEIFIQSLQKGERERERERGERERERERTLSHYFEYICGRVVLPKTFLRFSEVYVQL